MEGNDQQVRRNWQSFMNNQGNKIIFNLFCFQLHLGIEGPLQRDDLGTHFSPVH